MSLQDASETLERVTKIIAGQLGTEADKVSGLIMGMHDPTAGFLWVCMLTGSVQMTGFIGLEPGCKPAGTECNGCISPPFAKSSFSPV